MNYETLKPVIDDLKMRTKQDAFSLKINETRTPGLCDSKLGGMPYWDLEKPYPMDSEGKQMMLLAQINFGQGDFGPLFPQHGMLQFFIGIDDSYLMGADFDDIETQKNFRVIYHKTVKSGLKEEAIVALGIPSNLEEENQAYSPVNGTFALDIEAKSVSMGPEDYRFDRLFEKTAQAKKIDLSQKDSLYTLLNEQDYERVMEELDNTGHWMLGYPFFTQGDPRRYEDSYERYDTLLLQLDSDYTKAGNGALIWGDCGVANFFINKEDLINRNFEKVIYTWDCC